eukprot:scaffold204447_cov38-Tisochrysis_lutea.AAC.1
MSHPQSPIDRLAALGNLPPTFCPSIFCALAYFVAYLLLSRLLCPSPALPPCSLRAPTYP